MNRGDVTRREEGSPSANATDPTKNQTLNAVRDFLWCGGTSRLTDIATALRLDVDYVGIHLLELERRGQVKRTDGWWQYIYPSHGAMLQARNGAIPTEDRWTGLEATIAPN